MLDEKSFLRLLPVFLGLVLLSACTDYVGEYEGEYKKDFGDKDSFAEYLNKVNADVTQACTEGYWLWCSEKDGSYSSANNGLLEPYTDGSSSIKFYGKDENAYDFSTNTLGDDLIPYLRRNGGIAISVSDASAEKSAGIKVNIPDLLVYLRENNIVVAYENECSQGVYASLVLSKDGKKKGVYHYPLTGKGLVELQPDLYTRVAGVQELESLLANADEAEFSIVFSESCADDKSFLLVGVGLTPVKGSAEVDESSSSAKTEPAVESSSSAKTNPAVVSSSSAKSAVSSSSTKSAASSSSVKTSSSSSRVPSSSSVVKSSSSLAESSSSISGFLWNGADANEMVNTEFGSTKWYTYSDEDYGGTSTIVKPNLGEYSVCGGKCGEVHYGVKYLDPSTESYNNPYIGIGFNVDFPSWKYDFSDWEGLCVVYYSEDSLLLQLRVEDDEDVYKKAYPRVTLEATQASDGKYTMVDIPWSKFSQPDWKRGESLTGEDAAKILAGINLEFDGSAGDRQVFVIYEIGSYKRCITPEVKEIPADAFSVESSSSSSTQTAWDFLNPALSYGVFTDTRDNQDYKTIKIGSNTWMAQNLNYKAEGSLCYDNETANCVKYGRLYTWEAAQDACPAGWRLPDNDDYEQLVSDVGSNDDEVGPILKATKGWSGVGNGSDDAGFSALPAGQYGQYVDGSFEGLGSSAYLMFNDKSGAYIAHAVFEGGTYSQIGKDGLPSDDAAFSVRCIKTEPYPTSISEDDLVWYGGNKMNGKDSYLNQEDVLSSYIWLNDEAVEYIETNSEIKDHAPDDLLIGKCRGGFCGKVTSIPEGSQANFGFDVKEDPSEIEAWGGICITYSASKDGLTLYLGTGDNSYSKDTLEWNLYHIDLPKSETVTTACNPWHLFTQYAPAPVVKLDDYLPRVKDVSFMVKNDFNGASFNIVAIGSYKIGKISYDTFMQNKENRTSAWLYMNPDVTYGSFEDTRDGQVYKTVTIGDQEWMAENLNYKTTENGSYCFNDSSKYCNVYGRLYTWDVARNVCPTGWRLPSKSDYEKLLSVEEAGLKLKAAKGWYHNGNGDDTYGFAALPAGMYGSLLVGQTTYFWTSTENNGATAYSFNLYYQSNSASSGLYDDKFYGFSVRCIKKDEIIDERGDEPHTYKTVKIGNQTWMAENLNYVSASDGVNGVCAEDDKKCEKGRYYTWLEAINQTEERCGQACIGVADENDEKGICPDGWRLPSEADFETLIAQLENANVAAPLRSVDGWSESYGNGTNTLGFNAYPMGAYAEDEDDKYMKVGETAYFWSTKETTSMIVDVEKHYARVLDLSVSASINGLATDAAVNIRCIKK